MYSLWYRKNNEMQKWKEECEIQSNANKESLVGAEKTTIFQVEENHRKVK